MNLKKLHYFSGITISIFVGFHLFNHFFSLFGPSAHIELMNDLRVVYRTTFIETVLLLAVAIQIISGIKLFLKKRKTKSGFFQKLQIWTGLYLAFFLIVHVSAVLSGRMFLKLDTNFYFGVAGLNTFPLNLFFVPYYGLAIISFFGHVAAIHSMKMKRKVLGVTPYQQTYTILFMGVLLALVLLYGLTDGFNGIEIPKDYDIMIGK
ncbi:hypothetical protein HCU67_16100 [Muricauda sp. DJ-13]|uniref:Succinate dehydrogenase n=2 Tax=Croceivirga thetidis TaxID=2721623 RepID=A0ABX1GU53_9FLAO|nr:hypothetical protein [Croceivirga thetidis]